MIDPAEDQAAGLRRLFRRAPPSVVAMYVAGGRQRGVIALQTAHRLAGQSGRVLLLDEAQGSDALSGLLGLGEGADLLSVLTGRIAPPALIQTIPGLVGRVPVGAAGLALPLLDDERRERLVAAVGQLVRMAGCVLIHAECNSADDPSPFVFAAPRRLVVAEASRSGATEAYQVIKQLAAAGAGSLHVAVARARDRKEAAAFFASLNELVRRHVGVPLAWLGEIERDELAGGLASDAALSAPRHAEAAFLSRLAASGHRPARGMAPDSGRRP